jgi:hypothetical protein
MTTPNSDHQTAPARSVELASRDHAPVRVAADTALAPVADERRILTFMGEVRRLGVWAVPRLLRVRALLGEVKLDLRENVIPDGFTLDVSAFGARVTLIVPPDVEVAFDVFALMGNAINQADEPVRERADVQRVRVKGSAILGEVRVLVREREP